MYRDIDNISLLQDERPEMERPDEERVTRRVEKSRNFKKGKDESFVSRESKGHTYLTKDMRFESFSGLQSRRDVKLDTS